MLIVNRSPATFGGLGDWIAGAVGKLDNLGTAVCPTVAKVVGSAYGVPVGAAGSALPTACKYSRYVDLAHWASVGLEDIFGGGSSSPAPAPPPDAALQAQLAAAAAAAAHRRTLVYGGLAAAGVLGAVLVLRK
jgi:hypothetical protein